MTQDAREQEARELANRATHQNVTAPEIGPGAECQDCGARERELMLNPCSARQDAQGADGAPDAQADGDQPASD